MLAIRLLSAAGNAGGDKRMFDKKVTEVLNQPNLHAITRCLGKGDMEGRVQLDPGGRLSRALKLLDQPRKPVGVLRQASTSGLPCARDLETATDLMEVVMRVAPE